MKKLIELIIALLIGLTAHGQHLETQVFVQQTAMGWQQGYGIYLKTDRQLGVGWVHQSNRIFSTESYASDYSFIGIGAMIPIETCGKLDLMLTPKVGLVNRQFLAMLPEVTTRYQLLRNLNLGLGAGIRVRKSAITFSFIYQLF